MLSSLTFTLRIGIGNIEFRKNGCFKRLHFFSVLIIDVIKTEKMKIAVNDKMREMIGQGLAISERFTGNGFLRENDIAEKRCAGDFFWCHGGKRQNIRGLVYAAPFLIDGTHMIIIRKQDRQFGAIQKRNTGFFGGDVERALCQRFRIGQGLGSWNADPVKWKVNEGSQFPVEGYDNFVKQIVPRWTTTDDAIIAAYTALVDKVCPCVVLVHSQAGQFGQKVAQARPDKVKALVLVEPAGLGDPSQLDRLKNTPILTVYGDFIEQDSRWPTIRANQLKQLDAVRAAGGRADVVNLPQAGIKGNSHMMMMDKNSDQVADVIQQWLVKQGLYR